MADTEIMEEKQQIVDESILQEMSKDFSGYLEMDSSKERQVFYDSIEEMLTKLDEFGAMVDAIRGDTRLCVNETVPNIQTKCEEMNQIFQRVDHLEKFVHIVRQNVNTMDELVNKAENEMGSFSGIKKMFSSLVGSKKTAAQNDPSKQYVAPNIFITEEYLRPAIPAETNKTVSDNTQPVASSNKDPVSQDEMKPSVDT